MGSSNDKGQTMRMHVVLAHAMGGIQYSGVFEFSSDAKQQSAQGVFGNSLLVVEFDVDGPQSETNVVFVGQTYNATMDVHDFEVVYGNFDSAQRASGPQGQSLRGTL